MLRDGPGQGILDWDDGRLRLALIQRRKTSADTAHGKMVASGAMPSAASWLNDPGSP